MMEFKESEKYDVFISYSHREGDWVETELIPRLKRAQLNVAIDILLLSPGDGWNENLREALKFSKVLIPIFSPNYFSSEYAPLELDIAMKRYQNDQMRIIPISLRNAKEIPNRYGNIQFYDFSPIFTNKNISDEEIDLAWDELLDAIIKAVQAQKDKDKQESQNNATSKRSLEDLDRKTLEEDLDYAIENKAEEVVSNKTGGAFLDGEENAILDGEGNAILDGEETAISDGDGEKTLTESGGPLLTEDGGVLLTENGEAILTENGEPNLDESSTAVDVNIEGMALSDAYSQIDLLGYSDYVEALANFITSPKTKKPITIGIDAAWGGGKTTLMRLLLARLNPRLKEKDKKPKKSAGEHINTVWFDAWKYDQQEMLWAAMVLEILSQVRKQSDWWEKTCLFFSLNYKRFDRTKFLLSFLKSFAATIFLFALSSGAFSILASFLDKTWRETLQWVEDYSRVLVTLGVASLAYTIFKDTTGIIVSPFSLGISQYAKKPDYKEKIGFLSKFTEDFKYVIESITKNGEWPLVVFIDDLDRCSPTKAAEVIEAMNLLLDSEHCVFILGMDTAMLSRSIQAKYKEIQPFFDDGEYPSRIGLGRHFLEKIIQIDFRIPRPDPTYISSFISAQLGQKPEAKEQPYKQFEAENLIQAKQRIGKSANEAKASVLRDRPDLESMVNDAVKAVEKRTFEDNPQVIKAIKDMALLYLNHNPRRIKRFINIFRLQALIAHQRGILETVVSFDNLARWIVVGMRWPELVSLIIQDSRILASVQDDVLNIS